MAVKIELTVQIVDNAGSKISLGSRSDTKPEDQVESEQRTPQPNGTAGWVLPAESSVIGSGLSMPLPA